MPCEQNIFKSIFDIFECKFRDHIHDEVQTLILLRPLNLPHTRSEASVLLQMAKPNAVPISMFALLYASTKSPTRNDVISLLTTSTKLRALRKPLDVAIQNTTFAYSTYHTAGIEFYKEKDEALLL